MREQEKMREREKSEVNFSQDCHDINEISLIKRARLSI
jgi:hypothetical protein